MKIIWTKYYFIINVIMGEMRHVCVARKKPVDMIGCEASGVRVSERDVVSGEGGALGFLENMLLY